MAESEIQSPVHGSDSAASHGEDTRSSNALALDDVLADGQVDPCNITSNLQFRFDIETGNTLVEVKSPNGAVFGAQQIVLQGADLTSGGSLSDTQIIQMLLAQSKPTTDL